jgi:3-hydroxyisobutyrate dehydrogenase-like beta-hydroxyacid dehydrogenase|tara:strand:- start:608 stop:1480 length:873 start_codon:yes stop_codon:yes gene_type:complete
MSNIGFIGLGVMGFPMAGYLKEGGHELFVHNRSEKKTSRWVQSYGGSKRSTPAEVGQECNIVFLCVGRDEDVRSVVSGKDGLLETLDSGSIIVDHTTISASLAKELHQKCLEKEISFLDAPVSGGQAGAEKGQLTIMIGGDEEVSSSVQEYLNTYSKFTKYMGPAGSGQLTKMVNQICIAGLLQGLSEGMNFSELSGLDTREVIEVISKGAAQSWQMDNRWETMLSDEYDHGFAVDWMIKDLGIAIDQASKSNASLEATILIKDYYQEIKKQGGGRWDTSSLLRRLKLIK